MADGDRGRLDVEVKATIDARDQEGDLFLEGSYRVKTFRQRPIGVYGINKTIGDMIQAQIDLGRQAAEAHGET